MDPKLRSRIATGAMLIVLGTAVFVLRTIDPAGRWPIVLGLGLAMVAGYLFTTAKSLLVAGCLVAGLGAGLAGTPGADLFDPGPRLALGIGFVAIWVLAMLRERHAHWWPLIPGGILVLLGLGRWREFRMYVLHRGWPLILVILGVLVILGALNRARRPRQEPEDRP